MLVVPWICIKHQASSIYLIAREPQPGPVAPRGRGPPSRDCGLPARGNLAKAALRARSAGKDARDPRKTANRTGFPGGSKA